MRENLNISLPVALQKWVERQTDEGGYATASEYIRQMLCEEQKRQARRKVEASLQAALDSGAPRPVTDATWEESERRVTERVKTSSRKRRGHAENR